MENQFPLQDIYQSSKENRAMSQDTWHLQERFLNNVDDFNSTIRGLQKCKDLMQHTAINQQMRPNRQQRIQEMLQERKRKQSNLSQTILSPPLSDVKHHPNHHGGSSEQNTCLSQQMGGSNNRMPSFNQLSSQKHNNPNWQFSRMLGFQEIIEPDQELLGTTLHENSPTQSKQPQKQYQQLQQQRFNTKEIPVDRIDSAAWDLSAISISHKQQQFSFIEESKLPIKVEGDEEEEEGFFPTDHDTSNPQFLQDLVKQDENPKNQATQKSQQDEITVIEKERINVQSLFPDRNGHVLPIEDRLHVKNIGREGRIEELKQEEEKRIQQSLLPVPKISKSSDAIARNSSRFQQNPDLVARLMNDKKKRDLIIAKSKQEQEQLQENMYSFTPTINYQSAQLNRSVSSLLQWDQKKKLKQQHAATLTKQQEQQLVAEMQSKIQLCKGSQEIISNQSRCELKVEDRLLREGQSIQIRKEMAAKSEHDKSKELSIFRSTNSKHRNASLSSTSLRSVASNQRQSSCLSLSNITAAILQNTSLNSIHQDQEQLSNNMKANKQVQVFQPNFFNEKEQYPSNQSTIASGNSILPTAAVTQIQQYDENTHPNTTASKISGGASVQQVSVEVNPRRVAYTSNEYKKTEKIILPASQHGRTSMESLIQSSLFRKTKIFASDSQTTLIIDGVNSKGNQPIRQPLANKSIYQQQQYHHQQGTSKTPESIGQQVISQIRNDKAQISSYSTLFERKKKLSRSTSTISKNPHHPFLSN